MKHSSKVTIGKQPVDLHHHLKQTEIIKLSTSSKFGTLVKRINSYLSALFFSTLFIMSPWASAAQIPVTSSCEQLSLMGDKDQKDLYQTIAETEDILAKGHTERFKRLLHPSVTSNRKDLDQILEGTKQTFGLGYDLPKRNNIFLLRFANQEKDFLLSCGSHGTVRGVTGPRTQAFVFFWARTQGSGETVRLTTAFAPVPQSLRTPDNAQTHTWGLVLLHAQNWTQSGKSPQSLLDEAVKWESSHQPLNAWIIAEGAKRILNANPYFEPVEIQSALSLTARLKTQMESQIPSLSSTRVNDNIEILGFSTVFQGNGIEPGIKFRFKKEVSIEEFLETCKLQVKSTLNARPEIKSRFSGLECLGYQPEEPIHVPSKLGTMFVRWSDLK